jgi:hypothetical protein
MKVRALVTLLSTCAVAPAIHAETILIDDQVMVRESTIPRPTRGMHMSAVEQRFGAPVSRHPAVGEPPITRWDYNGFSVFFEHDRVIHAVAKGA